MSRPGHASALDVPHPLDDVMSITSFRTAEIDDMPEVPSSPSSIRNIRRWIRLIRLQKKLFNRQICSYDADD
eukprot:UN16050